MKRIPWIALVAALVVCAVWLSRKPPTRTFSERTETTKRERPDSPHAGDPPAPPLHPITPERLGIRTTPAVRDYAEHLRRLIASGEAPAVQTAAFHWFRDDPTAAGAWIRSQPDLAPLGPALGMISHHVSEHQGLEPALAWAALIPDTDARNQTYHELLALAIRNKVISLDQLDLTGIPREIIDDLESGALLD